VSPGRTGGSPAGLTLRGIPRGGGCWPGGLAATGRGPRDPEHVSLLAGRAIMLLVCAVTDGLAAWLAPTSAGTALRVVARAARETITRRPVTMPVAGRPGDFATLPAPEALPGFELLTADRPWRNEVSTSWLFPLAAFRPVAAVPRIAAPVLYQIAQHDGILPAGAVDRAIARTPGPKYSATPWTTSGPSAPSTTPPWQSAPATSSAASTTPRISRRMLPSPSRQNTASSRPSHWPAVRRTRAHTRRSS